jgi:hypothetical protein
VHGSNARNLSVSYLYVKLAKIAMSFLLSLVSLQQNWTRGQEHVLLGSVGGGEKRGVGHRRERWPNNVYTYE